MPVYEYACKKCGKEFTVTMGVDELDKKKVQCPKCKSSSVARQISAFYAKTSKKS